VGELERAGEIVVGRIRHQIVEADARAQTGADPPGAA
jgi:hypothetical protein